jgi:hypothetical protein
MTVALATRGYIAPAARYWREPPTEVAVEIEPLEVTVEIEPVLEIVVEVCED